MGTLVGLHRHQAKTTMKFFVPFLAVKFMLMRDKKLMAFKKK